MASTGLGALLALQLTNTPRRGSRPFAGRADDLLRQGQLPADGKNKSTAPLMELSISGAVEKKRGPKKELTRSRT